ncbi:beta-galactosidase GalA [Sphingomonas hankookensis]|jgi:beta-galactosidase|uniref:beta-galactosidase GalA n=1 Tax=Sphingomonas hankookensis TaxID=563996 RepID=UPI000B02CADA|nr:beta-galactosidase GalA [Sphingomonas hankookensis]
MNFVPIDRRTLLAGTAGTLATAGLPLSARAARRDAEPSGLLHGLSPRPGLPERLPAEDPSRTLLSHGWLFHEGDIVPPAPQTHDETYTNAKAGNARGAAAMDYDDTDWAQVSVPHDWASAQGFVETANVAQGYRPRGIGWYRRTLRLEPEDRGRKLELHFGAIATAATIWINGSVVARNFSGYNAITIDLTPFARFGDELNVIAIRVDATAMEGWWYEGAGLYRHVWLAKRSPVSIATDGVHCDPRLGSDGRWTVPVSVALESIARAPATATIMVDLLDPTGKVVASARGQAQLQPLGGVEVSLSLPVDNPQRWSIERPTLYTVRVTTDAPGGGDERRIAIGFRTIRFDAQAGFFLNEQPVKLKGVCLHQDHAGVGVAVPDALLAWRLQRMKDTGVNAIRCSHNAQADAFYQLCDRMGFVVMDENRIFNPAPENMAQLEWLVRAHRNHPSIILWSVFNEEPMQGTEAGVEMVRRMAARVHALDDSRPVTAAMNGSFYDPQNVSSVVDVMGFNYYQGDYDKFHALNPAKPSTSSEDTSAFMTRGAYATDRAAHVMSSMDTEAAPWGATHRQAWAEMAKRRFIAGGFVWTGFDYHGEPTPFTWPTIASFFGILDLCGFPKTAYDIHRAHWIDDQPVVGIAPHWTWPGKEGQPVELLVTSNAERVRVVLNGRMIGEQAVDRIMGNAFTVPYVPGTLEAVALKGGREVARAVHETAGAAVALRLTPARRQMLGDNEDVVPVTIDAVDAKGRHVPTENRMTRFTIDGATLIGVGNGDPNSHESEKAPERSLFNGLAQMLVQAGEGRGRGTIVATADGLRPARLVIDRVAATPRAQVEVTPPGAFILGWRRSKSFATAPDPGMTPPVNDNNSWDFTRSGTPAAPESGPSFRLYRAVLPERRRVMAQGGTLSFAQVEGRASVYVDGRQVGAKTDPAAGALVVPVPAGAKGVAVLIEAVPGARSGITGAVRLVPKG